MSELYFDVSATTATHPEVVREMSKAMLADFGNPSSAHDLGYRALKLIDGARTKLARAIGARAHEIYFTSGTTESNNWVFSGLAHVNAHKKKILISSIEHPSVRETANLFKNWGYNIVEIPVSSEGFVDLDFLERNIDSETLFVSVIHANNIFGTLQNLKKIGDICRRKGTLFHTDAAQSFGKIKILVHDWNIDLLSASGHKINGPKGVGLLYVRDGVKISPLFYGGGQEKGLRSGTENVPGILGFAKATEISLRKDWGKVETLRNILIGGLTALGGKVYGATGHGRLPNNIFVSFPGIDSEMLMHKLSARGIYVSTGSACDSKKAREDAALCAIGLSKQEMKSSIRISLPAEVMKKDIESFLNVLRKGYL